MGKPLSRVSMAMPSLEDCQRLLEKRMDRRQPRRKRTRRLARREVRSRLLPWRLARNKKRLLFRAMTLKLVWRPCRLQQLYHCLDASLPKGAVLEARGTGWLIEMTAMIQRLQVRLVGGSREWPTRIVKEDQYGMGMTKRSSLPRTVPLKQQRREINEMWRVILVCNRPFLPIAETR